MQIEGSSAIVVGGASGLGEATARALHARGASVTIADVNAEKGAALASELGLELHACDVREETQVKAAVERAGERLGDALGTTPTVPDASQTKRGAGTFDTLQGSPLTR